LLQPWGSKAAFENQQKCDKPVGNKGIRACEVFRKKLLAQMRRVG